MMVGMSIRNWFGWIVEDRQRETVGGGRGSGVFVFLDESGDLVFGERSSGWFVVGCVVTDDVKGAGSPVKKVFRGFRKKDKKKRKGVMFHAVKEKDQTRKRLLRLVAAYGGLRVVALVVDKGKVPMSMRGERHFLYNHLAERAIDSIVAGDSSVANRGLTLVAARRETKKHLKRQFAEHIRERVLKNRGVAVAVEVQPAAMEWVLQVADAVSWAVFQKYEKGDGRYCDLLGGKLDEVFFE